MVKLGPVWSRAWQTGWAVMIELGLCFVFRGFAHSSVHSGLTTTRSRVGIDLEQGSLFWTGRELMRAQETRSGTDQVGPRAAFLVTARPGDGLGIIWDTRWDEARGRAMGLKTSVPSDSPLMLMVGSERQVLRVSVG